MVTCLSLTATLDIFKHNKKHDNVNGKWCSITSVASCTYFYNHSLSHVNVCLQAIISVYDVHIIVSL